MKYIIAILVMILSAACTLEQTVEKGDEEMTRGIDVIGKLGWSASGVLTQNGSREVSLQANFPEAKSYTAQFSISGTDLRYKKAEAEIKWVVEGNFVTRRITIANGVSIQGAGQAVSIKIRDVSPVVIPGVATDYTVSVQVVPGSRGSTNNPPTLSGDAHIVIGGASLNLNIPDNSGVISVAVLVENTLHNAIPDQAVIVRQQDAAALDVALYDPRQYFWVPIQGSATVLRLENHTADPCAFTVIYGIEG